MAKPTALGYVEGRDLLEYVDMAFALRVVAIIEDIQTAQADAPQGDKEVADALQRAIDWLEYAGSKVYGDMESRRKRLAESN